MIHVVLANVPHWRIYRILQQPDYLKPTVSHVWNVYRWDFFRVPPNNRFASGENAC